MDGPAALSDPRVQAVASIPLAGGDGAPRRARRLALQELDPHLDDQAASDVVLIISELVTNSVRHAGVDADAELSVHLVLFADRVRVTVSDPGSDLEPRLISIGPDATGGFGLRLVDHLSAAWGVLHEPASTTQVWCDLALSSPTTA